jgi:hypothetical protein
LINCERWNVPFKIATNQKSNTFTFKINIPAHHLIIGLTFPSSFCLSIDCIDRRGRRWKMSIVFSSSTTRIYICCSADTDSINYTLGITRHTSFPEVPASLPLKTRKCCVGIQLIVPKRK